MLADRSLLWAVATRRPRQRLRRGAILTIAFKLGFAGWLAAGLALWSRHRFHILPVNTQI